jgi:hypothetical protein
MREYWKARKHKQYLRLRKYWRFRKIMVAKKIRHKGAKKVMIL